MKQRALAAALAAAIGLGATAPALANGAASTRNILFLGVAAGMLITNYNHKVREKREQRHQAARKQAAYRDCFYQKNGYYPTQQQLDDWYKQTYGVNPPQS